MVTKSMHINEEIKVELDKLKIHPRETYSDVIARVINNKKTRRKANGGEEEWITI